MNKFKKILLGGVLTTAVFYTGYKIFDDQNKKNEKIKILSSVVEMKRAEFPVFADSIALVYEHTYKQIPNFNRDLTHQEYLDLLKSSRKFVTNPRALPSIDDEIIFLEDAIDKENIFKAKKFAVDTRIQEFAKTIQEQNRIKFSKKQLQKLGLDGR